jgi:hypothetical protein
VSTDNAHLGTPVPVLRMFDAAPTYDFYLDYLGFRVEWEHRFEPGLPLYARIRLDDVTIDLSQHYGDGTPGTVLWIPVDDVESLHRDLIGKQHPRSRPGIEHDAPGGPTMTVIDPSSNRLRFCEPLERPPAEVVG